MKKQPSIEKWDGFCGMNFLKVTSVENENDGFVVDNVELFTNEDGTVPRLNLLKNDELFLFDLNVTNSNFCKNNGMANPRMMIGKKLYFKKVLVNSPKTNKEVESLRICKIE